MLGNNLVEDQQVRDEPQTPYREEVLCDRGRDVSVKECKESRLEILRNWEVRIKCLTVGCVIEVGCKSFAFSTIEEGLKELSAYYADPHTARQKWETIERKLNN